jgi:WhiB family transcriptional regulator, redox-sensing transcriptional regulator
MKEYFALAKAINEAATTIPCQETDPEAWFADKGDWWAVHRSRELCNLCPVKRQCAEYAIVNNELYGVWGGLTTKERLAIRKKAR